MPEISTSKIVATFLFGVALGVLILVLYLKREIRLGLEEQLGSRKQPYLDQTFSVRTVANFLVNYRIRFLVERVNTIQFMACRIFNREVQEAFALDFNRLDLIPCFEKASFRFRLAWPIGATEEGRVSEAPRVILCRLLERNGERFVKDIPDGWLPEVLREWDPMKTHGCNITVAEFQPGISDTLIEENYAMMTDEQKEEVLKEERYSEFEEMLAVAALKRRLDFFKAQKKQRHETDDFIIETEQAGYGLKIKWHFKEYAPSEYDLLGFRSTGGFYKDKWDEDRNGLLVVHRPLDGEVIEPLIEGQANFYTFFMKPWREDEKSYKRSPLRFQVTIETRGEREAIEATLARFEHRRTDDPQKENLSRALKELGRYRQFDTAIEEAEKKAINELENSSCGEEEKRDKISRLHAVVTIIRAKYEQ